MKKIKKITRVVGFLDGKRIKTTTKKWTAIMENPKNKVVFKEDDKNENNNS